jgi:aminobenzoyl-glutamate transport protein
MTTSYNPKKGFLHYVEKSGNALPHPALLFGMLALLVMAVSVIGSILGWKGVNPATGEHVEVFSLLSREGLHRIILEMVNNYTDFAPLGVVMVALLGTGVADHSGLLKTAVITLMAKTHEKAITFAVVFAGLLSNVAADFGYVLIIPLGGIIFHSLGRNPLVGLCAAFAGVSAGFSANILISTQDALLSGLSTEAARIIDTNYFVLPTANYYFMAASTFLLASIATIVTSKWVEPRLGKYTGDVPQEKITQLTALEKKGLIRAGLVFLGWFVLLAIALIPENGILRGVDGTVLRSPIFRGFIALLFVMAASAGIVYGFTIGKYKKAEDIIFAMNENYRNLAAFLVLAFFCSQFVAWFRWSNLGLLLAVNGAEMLQNSDIGLIPLVIIFTTFAALLNFVIDSASAKWAIIGPVFVPIFMLMGYSPELAQAAFRVGDSVTNVITPILAYFALIIVYFQKYDKKVGIGTIIANMLPYSIAFFIFWLLFLIGWILLGIPLGPGSPLFYSM